MSTPGYPAYYYGDSQTGSMSNLSVGGGGGMRRYASKSSIAGGQSLTGSRSLLYGSRRSLYSTYTMSGMSYVLPVVANQPDPWRRPADNWPIAFLSIFINPLFGIFALLLAEQSKIYYAKCQYLKASQYGSYAKGTAAGGLYCTVIVLLWVISAVVNETTRYNY
ncbi:hypothetical protein PoB_006551000 [Plakobranchus ocellatus]|uniref:Uncharacterized protein n=1 Tax=Plakobranchus ocellatus TaxID=259542 RepID=A0AAV4D4I7_9GAST|nr:hypothetical protein PoB_006551000 [Plakobranchus ocellatus]